VFGDVRPGMTILREEVFGPVLAVIGYRDEDEAVRIADDTVYGLAAYVSSADIAHARAVAARLRAGTVNIHYPAWDVRAPLAASSSRATGANMPISASTTSRAESRRGLLLNEAPSFFPLSPAWKERYGYDDVHP
jgi:acyl-CoA reductase-like NAD-dependent aldehyde dehydrogenase